MTALIKFLLTIILPALCIIFGAVFLYSGLSRLVKANDSINWPTTQGEVISSTVFTTYSSGSGRGSTTYHARIRYEFSLNGAIYMGARISYGDHGTGKPDHATGIVDRYPEGKEVMVYYMSDNPEECLLEPGRSAGDLLLPGLGFIILLIGILLSVIFAYAVKREAEAKHNQK